MKYTFLVDLFFFFKENIVVVNSKCSNVAHPWAGSQEPLIFSSLTDLNIDNFNHVCSRSKMTGNDQLLHEILVGNCKCLSPVSFCPTVFSVKMRNVKNKWQISNTDDKTLIVAIHMYISSKVTICCTWKDPLECWIQLLWDIPCELQNPWVLYSLMSGQPPID